MDIYTLDSGFRRNEVVDNIESVIWTERYRDPGDINLSLAATPEALFKLQVGIFLACTDSKEVMIINTCEVKDSKLKVSGTTLPGFLDNRPVRNSAVSSPTQGAIAEGTPGLLLDYLAAFSIGPSDYLSSGMELIGYDDNTITNLSFPRFEASFGMGDYLVEHGDETGAWVTNYPVTFGSLLSALKAVADTYNLGFTIYLEEATDDDYSLIFSSYIGRDLTSDQDVHPVVQFSPVLDNLTNVSSVISNIGYKNVAYVFATPIMEGWLVDPGVAYADASAEIATDFDRRVILTYATDIKYADPDITEDLDNYNTLILPQLNQRAKDVLANNNYVRMMDGEIVPQSGYTYGVNYALGDIVELLARDGTKQKARITEFIRSQDSTGDREYPTVSVIV